MSSPTAESPESLDVQVDWQKFNIALKALLDATRGHLEPEKVSLLSRLSLCVEVQHDLSAANVLFSENKDELKTIIVTAILHNEIHSPAVVQELLRPFAENAVMAELYVQFGKVYKLNSGTAAATDCVQILRQSPTFKAILDAEENPTRFFSEGSDLVLDERLGRVAATVDRKGNDQNFEALRQFRPTADKMYVFGLVKPPLQFSGKPNITHLQIPTTLNSDPAKLAIIHASSEKGSVSVEGDIVQYLSDHRAFERVYVIEIDLNDPYAKNLFTREPRFTYENYDGRTYERPSVYSLPVVLDQFNVRHNKGGHVVETEVPIYNDERRTLEIISDDNRALEYLTILTGIREGKLGDKQNIEEAAAFRLGMDPSARSLGLHQTTRVVMPLFNPWIENLDERKAVALGSEVHALWQKKHTGQEITWNDVVPFLNSYDFSDLTYKNVTISTICSYLLIRHLYEDQLLGAYNTYGETFFGLQEQPESVIAVSGAYRSSMDVMVTGSQQYRVAEIGYQLSLLDKDFNFTQSAKDMPEYKQYLAALEEEYPKQRLPGTGDGMSYMKEDPMYTLMSRQFLVDGYRGIQFQYLSYMCYRSKNPKGTLRFRDFASAYGTSQHNMLSPKGKAISAMHGMYKDLLGRNPSLLMTEAELRGHGTALNTHDVDFANEGLLVLSNYKKMTYDNWDAINGHTIRGVDGIEDNSIVSDALEERSLETNEISKIDPRVGQRFYNLIKNLPGEEWYRNYPAPLLSVCFTQGFFREEGQHKNDGVWIEHTQKFLLGLFQKNLPAILGRLSGSNFDEEDKVYIAAASSVLSIDAIVSRLQSGTQPKDILSTIPERTGIRLSTYTQSFDRLQSRFQTSDASLLEVKEGLTEKEKQAKFTLHVFDAAYSEALARGYTMDFAIVATSMAALECGWGTEENEWGEPTLYAAANNIFSIKANYDQYTESDYRAQDDSESFYIHHTKEYFDPTDPHKYTEHYEAFRKYDDVEGAVKDFFDLMDNPNYDFTTELARGLSVSKEPNKENQTKILDALLHDHYATDPAYVAKAVSVGGSVSATLRQYGVII